MQNNNNNAIADELQEIALCLSAIDTEDTSGAIANTKNEIAYLDTVGQKAGIPELRALSHWMMLNTELEPENEEIISTLLSEGSYYKWINILSTLIREYKPSLLPEIYKALTLPIWLVKPSAPLLCDLAKWIETSKVVKRASSDETSFETTSNEQEQIIDASSKEKQLSSELLFEKDKNLFDEIEPSTLEKEFTSTHLLESEIIDNTEINSPIIDNSIINSDDAATYRNEDEELIVENILMEDFIVEDITKELETKTEPKSESETLVIDDITDEVIIDEKEETILETNEFSDEANDIVMTLTSIGLESKNVFDDSDKFLAELQRLELLADITGYSNISIVSDWCQQNLALFAKEQLDESRKFIESGECWTWIELINNALEEPENISHVSDLSAALSRDEWLEPLPVASLQNLLLFLRNPENNTNTNDADNETATDSKDTNTEIEATENTESSEFTLRWDEDVHPELLEVFFEETTAHIVEVSNYLKEIGNTNTTTDERSHIRRIAHTIKGGSAVVGVTALSIFAHKLEIIFDHGINHTLSDDGNKLLKNASNCLEELYSAIKEKTDAPQSFPSTLSELTHYAESLDDDDEILELSAPTLPDFITKSNTEAEPEKPEEIPTDKANTDNQDIESEDKEAEQIALPALNRNEELSDFTAELDDIVMTLVTTEANTEKKPFKLGNYIDELQRLDMLAEISGFPEILKVSSWYQKNLQIFAKKSTKKAGKFISSGESWAWLELVSACLSDPDEITHLSTLSTELTRKDWAEALAIEDLQALLLVLNSTKDKNDETQIEEELDTSSSNISEEDKQEAEINTIEIPENTEEIAEETIDQNIVTWDEDVHPELLSVYLQETSEQVGKIATLLHIISKGKADKEQQAQAARIAHTIKGASGVVGITEIVNLTHKLEDILDYAVNNKIPKKTADLLAETSDCLESLFESVQEKSAAPEEFESVLEKLTNYADSIKDSNTDTSHELNMPELPDFIDQKKKVPAKGRKKSTKAKSTNTTKTKTASSPKKMQVSASNTNDLATESHIRVPTSIINKLLNLAGELVTTSTQVSDKIENTLVSSTQIKDQDKRVHKMLKELSATIYKQENNQTSMLSNMKNKEFDTLEMDTYNELHSIAGLLTESILDSETIDNALKQQLDEVQNDLRTLEQLNKELSDTILSSRMESLNTLIPRLERIVRQTCRKTDKKAELIVTGNDINVDTEILSGLVDPLLHLLRNSVDHGIESSKDRKAKKKKVTGKINLDFSRQGNFIHMQLKDDGAGIDPEKIYLHAIDKGMITPEQEFSKNEILKLVLQPGFSTQTKVSDISGRGVGMDVVKKGVEELKGSLSIDSELGQGTTIDIKIPLTLVTSATLLVSTAGNQVAIPTDSIEQLHYLAPEDVLLRKKQHFIRYKGKEIIIESLAGILGWEAKSVDFSQAQTLLLVKSENKLHALYIDKIIHSREVVIKSLAHFIDSAKGVIGACHLTDGAVAPVLNLPQLLNLNEKTNEKANNAVKQIKDAELLLSNTPDTPQILVVDDSLSNRKALSLIIEKTEYDVITAVDGLDALNIMNEKHIDMVFTDLEMPRMTGLELTQAIRAWEEKKHLPVVMVTSRSTNKHRELAEKAGVDDYLTKPVGTETLLESMEKWLKQTATV